MLSTESQPVNTRPAVGYRFALHTLIQGYRGSDDIERRMPVLSAFLASGRYVLAPLGSSGIDGALPLASWSSDGRSDMKSDLRFPTLLEQNHSTGRIRRTGTE